ncbi:Arogenate dehydratase 4 [Forsythia ovata]|uniref:Arogenate dehydratase 4 n=1 Tax=Forsythia ovata TaxID=205694 RepID=A0ABD1X804_9LAMI
MHSAIAPASGEGDADQLTMSFQEKSMFSLPCPLRRARYDWQSSYAILASKVVLQQLDNKKNGGVADGITAVNGYPTLDLVPVMEAKSPSALPKPLIIADLSLAPMHGSELRVAYQRVLGAYIEAVAGKAYPNCGAIPCDQFEVAFQAVELLIANRAVLPVENSLGLVSSTQT